MVNVSRQRSRGPQSKGGSIFKSAVWIGALWIVATSTSAQSLAEIAKKEKDRRRALQTEGARTFGNVGTTASVAKRGKTADESVGGSEKERASSGSTSLPTPGVQKTESKANLDPQQTAPATSDIERSPSVPNLETADVPSEQGILLEPPTSEKNAVPPPPPAESPAPVALRRAPTTEPAPQRLPMPTPPSLQLRGALYVDWFRAAYAGGARASQLSNRLKLEATPSAGARWRIALDLRDKLNAEPRRDNTVILYEARLDVTPLESPYRFSLGQMNLYDSAGAGQLLGGVLGYQIDSVLSLGGYAGLEPGVYDLQIDPSYQKYGVFARYDGEGARSVLVSFNTLRFDGMTERRYLYLNALAPVQESVVLYGNLEYELDSRTAGQDRLSRALLNGRFDINDYLDLTAHFSMGKGLDFHRFLLDLSKDPTLNDAELERFYYSRQYGLRLGVKPLPQIRLFLAQRRSEQKDRGIRNDTTQIGGSTFDLFQSGISLYGNYNLNRGDAAESDSYSFSVSRDFGRFSWTGYYSSVFNGIRLDPGTGTPEIVHIPNRRTVSNDIFLPFSRAVAVSVEHEHASQQGQTDNTLFMRLIYRY